MSSRASVRVETMTLPAYVFHEDPFPPLPREGSRRIYPYCMQDDLTDERAEREFKAVVLENGLLRVTVLPELGGHVLSMRDLVHDREVLYRNVPLKFGLIAMRGAWVACGIEWNFPHVGHAVTTSDTVSWHTAEYGDGSATVHVGAIEHLTRMAWRVALTLYPDDWRLHVHVRLFNRTPFAHRIYFWSNAAVPARADLRLLLPATRVFSWWYGADGDTSFPINKGRDLSRYTTLDRGGDLFAKDLRADWFGAYYDALDCGILHHASRFDVPGRKLFTWGTSDHGKLWAELLNEEGQPYVEIQSGRFVHQGVHRLMPPYSVEAWKESWGPIWGIGGAVHATDDLVLNAVREGRSLTLRLLALVPIPQSATVGSPTVATAGKPAVALLVARQDGSVLAETSLAFAAGEIKSLPVALRSDAPVTLDLNGQEVTLRLEGDSVRAALDAVPPHTAVPDKLTEEEPKTPSGWLLRAREHEERNDIQAAADACRKALDLDPLCAAAMAGLAQWHLKRSETAEAREWAAKALQTDLQHEDALWWLGVADVLGPKDDRDATAHFHALRRSPRYAAGALTLLGELALRRRDARAAFRFLAAALERNSLDSRAWALAAFAARASGDIETATTFLDQCEEENPLEPLLWSERYFLAGSGGVDAYLQRVFGRDPQPYLEAACDYERLGAWDAAAAWLSGVALQRADPARRAMPLYHAAHALWHLGKPTEAVGLAREAAKQSPLFIFPHRHEDGQALRTALAISPDDALAHLLLGTWLASLGRWDDAFPHWTRAAQLAPAGEIAILAWRNTALMKWRKGENAPESLSAYSSALDLLSGISDWRLPIADLKTPNTEHRTPNTAHPTLLSLSSWRLWLERDRVLAAAGRHAERIAAFGSAPDDVKAKWQVLARWAEAYLRAGQAEQALDILSRCRFKPWEGEGRSRASWKEAHMLLGHRAKDGGDLATARKHFEAAAEYPRHLGVGKPLMTDDADALFWAGWCALQTGDREAARRLLTLAANEPQPRDATSADFKSRAADALEQLGGGHGRGMVPGVRFRVPGSGRTR